MPTDLLRRAFARIGARVSIGPEPWLGEPRIDVRSDARGEYFHLSFTGAGQANSVEVVDARVADRHLLLLVRDGAAKSKFLCGHDERHWFVAAVPEDARGVTGVATAKAALQPRAVQELIERIRPKDPFRRRNTAYVRQGEWFFVPAEIDPPGGLVLRNEPLTRGNGGTPHVLQFAYRTGGEAVYVNRRNPHGISEAAYRRLPIDQQRRGWTRLTRDPELFAKGSVRHPDHATVNLAGWHRVLMNTERSLGQ